MNQIQTVVFSTSDGGTTWEKVEDSNQALLNNNPAPNIGSYSTPFGRDNVISFLDSKNGFINFYQTKDGGYTWKIPEIPMDDSNGLIFQRSQPWFSSSKNGVFILRSYEKKQIINPPGDIFEGMHQAQSLYYSNNAGVMWQHSLLPEKLGTIFFLDDKSGWFLGRSSLTTSDSAILYMSNNSGETWNPVSSNCPIPLGSKIQFVNTLLGFASNQYVKSSQNPYSQFDLKADSKPYLWITNDGGVTWKKIVPTINP